MINFKKREFNSPNISFKFPDGFYIMIRSNMIKFISEKRDEKCGLIIIEIEFSDMGKTIDDAISVYNDCGMVMRENCFYKKRLRGVALCAVFDIPDYVAVYTEIYNFPQNRYGENQVTIRIYALSDLGSKIEKNIDTVLKMRRVKNFLNSIRYK